jgi:ribosomal-protein-alanine N-acetyltransferase
MFPRLETEFLFLRPFTPEDASKVFELSQEAGMRKWLPSQVYRDEAHAASVLAFLISQYRADIDPAVSPLVLGIELEGSGELVGHVGLSPLDGDIEVGFAVAQSHQRRGIATQAVRALCEWAARRFPQARILGIASRGNIASQEVLLRAGFEHATRRTMLFQGRQQPVEVFLYAAGRPTRARADQNPPARSMTSSRTTTFGPRSRR